MEQTTNTQQRPRLERPSDGRSIAGVAAATANYFSISVGLVRAGFLISIFFGGIGLAAYIAGWLLIAEEGEDDSVLESWLANVRSPSSWIGLVLVGGALLILLDSFSSFSGSTVFAAILVILGVLLYRGAFDDGLPRFSLSRPPEPGVTATVVDDSTTGSEAPPSGQSVDDLEAAHDELDTEIPLSDGDDGPPPRPPPMVARVPRRKPRQRSRLGRFTMAALLISLGSMAVADTADWISFDVGDYFGVALMVVGTGLAIGALFGRAYTLIVIGLALVAMIQVTSWFDVELGGGFGDPTYRIETVSTVDPEYRLLAGELTVDFSDLDTSETVQTEISLGAGQLTVEVPDDMNVIVELRVVAGEINTPDGRFDGTDLDRLYENHPDGASGTLVIEASIVFGQLDLVIEDR